MQQHRIRHRLATPHGWGGQIRQPRSRRLDGPARVAEIVRSLRFVDGEHIQDVA
jgi:hypothetical protein